MLKHISFFQGRECDISEYIPFDTNDEVEWFFTPESESDKAVQAYEDRLEGLTNYFNGEPDHSKRAFITINDDLT
jgi:hypothetical protein